MTEGESLFCPLRRGGLLTRRFWGVLDFIFILDSEDNITVLQNAVIGL